MGYMIRDRLEVSVLFNNVEYPLGLGENTLSELRIVAGSRFKLPMLGLQVVDTLHTLDRVNLQDGLLIGISLKAKKSNQHIMTFRKFNHRREFNGEAYVYTLDGYLDFPRFWLGTGVSGIQASSSDALRQIASTCGMKYSGVGTNDVQLWMQRNQTFSTWARDIESHGYIDDGSYMKWAVQFDGTLTYRNVNVPSDPVAKLVAYQDQEDTYRVLDYGPSIKSGLKNAINGYQSVSVGQSATAADSTYERITVPRDSKSPAINTKVREIQGRGAVTHAPIDWGNVHEAYVRAAYQNARYASLMNTSVEFLLQDFTGLHIFDSITFSTETDRQRQDQAYAGNYQVSTIIMCVKEANYWEKVVGTRTGVNLDYLAA